MLLAKELPEKADEVLAQSKFRNIPDKRPIWLALINLAMNQADKATDPLEKERKWTQASGYVDMAESTWAMA